MITAIRAFRDKLLGRGEASSTVPLFDGALKPNQLLERAETVQAFEAPEDLATDGESLYVADGARLCRVTPAGELSELREFGAPITALACLPAALGGGVAVAVDGRQVILTGGAHAGRAWQDAGGRAFHAVNSLHAGPRGLILTDGSTRRAASEWRHDLMEHGRSGRVIAIDLPDGVSRELASDLHCAFGAAAHGNEVWVSESWKHRIVSLAPDKAPLPVLDRLPAYPSRLAPAVGGGWWLTAFAPRTQLVEFVLRENVYRKRMISTIAPDLWICPQLRPSQSFIEPLQGGGVKQMGILKPWAPPRSYGLVIRLDAGGLPVYSLHSRGDGTHHGIVAAAELGGTLYVLSKGTRTLLRVDIAAVEKELLA